MSRRARLARVAIVLTMDAVLAGAGVAMMASYFDARAEASRPREEVAGAAKTPEPPKHEAQVEVAPPRVVKPDGGGERPPTTVHAPAPTGKPPAPPPTPPPKGGGKDEPGAVLGGIARKPDAGVAKPPPATPPAPTTPPDAAIATAPPPPDAAVAGPPTPPPPPETTAPEQTLANGVQRTVEGHMGQVRRCWENIAKSSSDSNLPEGTIEIQFAVQPSGSPSGVQIVQNATGSPQLGECVVALVNSWSFPGHDGDPVVFVWPFIFKATK